MNVRKNIEQLLSIFISFSPSKRPQTEGVPTFLKPNSVAHIGNTPGIHVFHNQEVLKGVA